LTGSIYDYWIGSDFNKRLKWRWVSWSCGCCGNTDAIMVFWDVAKKGLIDQGGDPSRVLHAADTTICFYDSTAQPDRDLIFCGQFALPGKR